MIVKFIISKCLVEVGASLLRFKWAHCGSECVIAVIVMSTGKCISGCIGGFVGDVKARGCV